MKVYTKSGDKGETSLYDGNRVGKNNMRIKCYGTLDELNSSLGVAKLFVKGKKNKEMIEQIQRYIFRISGELSFIEFHKYKEKTNKEDVENLEKYIDGIFDITGFPTEFVLPGKNKASAFLHISRTICRRAEILIIELSQKEKINEFLLSFVNRMSDLIFALAFWEEKSPLPLT